MAVFSGPEIPNSGLVLHLDTANLNSYDRYENLVTNSEVFGSWLNNGGAITISSNSELAPNGTLTAEILSQSSVINATRYLGSNLNVTYNGQTYTISCWVKKISGTDLGGQLSFAFIGDAGRTSSINATSEWQRFIWTTSLPIGGSATIGLLSNWDINGAANNNVYAVWGFQSEIGSQATDYYPTTSSAKTRGTSWTSIGTSGNIGTLTNGPGYNSSNNGSIVFDGTNDYISVSHNSIYRLTSSTTINIWYYPTSSSGNIITYQKGGWEGYIIGVSSITYSGQTGSNDFSTGLTSRLNQWQMFTWVINRTTNQYLIYLNGVQINAIGITHPALGGTDPLYIGARGVPDSFFTGRISNISYYNATLTIAEIRQIFEATRDRYGI